jgi:hypothetical protein
MRDLALSTLLAKLATGDHWLHVGFADGQWGAVLHDYDAAVAASHNYEGIDAWGDTFEAALLALEQELALPAPIPCADTWCTVNGKAC